MNTQSTSDQATYVEPVAIVGMACRVPGAADIDQFWRNLRSGTESVTFFGPEIALAAGANPESVRDPQYVLAAPVLDHIEEFDAGLFGFTRREAEILDPQHRIFLECAVAALENAGYDPARYRGDIGVYGGVGTGEYQWYHLLRNPSVLNSVGRMAISLSNNTDYVANLVSYRLNLRGPAVTVSTACSTSLVAVHLAAEAVRNGECDMALAGGVSVEITQYRGYQYHEGGILSPDGHCRAFDADAQGTIWGSGGGIVLLKRLSQALADGDTVHAVLLGSAVNNDGADKVGFSAPSVSGQAAVIGQALGVAQVTPDGIDYVEAHGTGTTVGDPIEIRALSEVFDGREPGSCRLGTVKTNIGHLAAGAGVVGLIKTALSLSHETLPPTLHFRSPNPAAALDDSPFRVVREAEPWPRRERPRRAGVSSFGMGGTNAHAVLQEAPAVEPAPTDGPQVLLLSARTPSALEHMAGALATHLSGDPAPVLDDVAYTLQVGRREMPYRRALVASGAGDAVSVLRGASPRRLLAGKATAAPRLLFLFPGQGTQRVGMVRGLYERYEVVREHVDRGREVLRPVLGFDVAEVLFASGDDVAAATERLRRTGTTQPVLFLVEYAMAQLWRSWGVQPTAMLGHSLGEYVAACLSGVFTFTDGLRLVAMRARLMESRPAGAMLAVHLPAEDLELADTGLDLAAVNAPTMSVVSGPPDAVDRFESDLADSGVPVTRLRTSHAFHSAMMAPLRDEFTEVLTGVELRPPQVPVVSNVTGDWLTDEQATSPAYWVEHLCAPVLFGAGLRTLLADGPAVLCEVGPGASLSGLARMQPRPDTPDPVTSLPATTGDEQEMMLGAAGRLWTLGVEVDWAATHQAHRRRVPVPGHPFERERFWIEPPTGATVGVASPEVPPRTAKLPMEDWFWVPLWRQTIAPPPAGSMSTEPWLVLRDPAGSTDPLVAELRRLGGPVATVTPGGGYARQGLDFVIAADRPGDHERVLDALVQDSIVPRRVLHAWAAGECDADQLAPAAVRETVEVAFSGLLWLVQAFAARSLTDKLDLVVVTRGTQDVDGAGLRSPARAMVGAPLRVLPMEFPGLRCRMIDIDDPAAGAGALLAEVAADDTPLVAYQRGRRWVPHFDAVRADADAAVRAPLRERGTYVITGGLGGVGLSIAESLARRVQARVVLVGRSAPPERGDWARLANAGGKRGWQAARLCEIEQLGGEVHVVTADVTDPHQARLVREAALARFGTVDGIIHAAGIAGGTLVEAQSRETMAAVIDPKVYGTLALADAFDGDRLDFFAVCSSVTAVAGGLGQVDYCAANLFLDAFAHVRSHPWPVISINWGAWLEVGMAAETWAPTAFRDLERGVRREPMGHPQLETVETRDTDTRVVCAGRLTPKLHWLLDEHRIAGTPTVPGTGHLELVRAAFGRSHPGRAVELRDVVFLTPLSVPDGESREVRVVLTDAAAGGPFVVESWDNGVRREHVRGHVQLADPAPVPPVDLAALRERCGRISREARPSASGLLTFGPRWSNLRQVTVGAGEELALLEACGAVAGDLADYWMHPAVLDEATSFGDFSGAEGQYLPLGYGQLIVRGPLPSRVYSHLRHRDSVGPELLTCDLTLVDENGTVLVEIGDFMLRRIDVGAVSTAVQGVAIGRDAASGEATVDATVGSTSPAESSGLTAGDPTGRQSADGDDAIGIRPTEGGEAFARLLGLNIGPQVVVTALHLPTLIDRVSRADLAQVDDVASEVPTADAVDIRADGDYAAPSDQVEQQLVRLWEEATGTTGIGVTHDFFEVGGNSLVAAQLMARVRTTFGVKLPMRALFEGPTISAMAQAVQASILAKS
ncbi:type I polyketide synthase [Micromonospora antibiotica]|uniref:SDR family NAD(P)-dependent oxidoreductase n=1 Tax=Micromonospora antibiotica TaxID=2807623 RepID=A0ABS3V787_9ACTN|nr:type I polyketide synthase [Micromonospora antibiotica]MBO4161486.1 SDR family NAD(P)-dependent oxidoreductase [Micromonospora antibiotica]